TEALILGNIYSQLIQNQTDLKVEEKFNLNGTMITMSAMERGDIDTFTDYTGVLSANVLKESLSADTDQVYETVKDRMREDYRMEVSESLGFSNTYVFAVTREVSQQFNLTKLSQLIADASSLRLGCTTAFTQREDLLPKLERDHHVTFRSVEGLEGNIRYQALNSGKIDVIDAFETDALLKKMDLVKLEDDIGFFPPYEAVAITREETLEKYPGLERILEQMEGTIDTEEMMEMNYQVDVEGRTPKEVAIEFLEGEHLISR
ncbi:MAG: glycine betaine ABC transporter substrate-binding protein, partial [Blautia sp.]